MTEMRLKGEQVAGLDVAEVRAEAVPSDGPSTFPELPLRSIGGASLDSKALAGKVVVVEMWATWCPPCRSTMAWLNTLQAKHGDRLAVIAIAVDSPAAEVLKMSAQLKPSYHIVQGTPEIIASFGEVAAVPKLFVFDRSGKRIQTFYGAPPDLHQKIDAAVAGALGSRF